MKMKYDQSSKKVNEGWEKIEIIQQSVPEILIKLGYHYDDAYENEFDPKDVSNQMQQLELLLYDLFDKPINPFKTRTLHKNSRKISWEDITNTKKLN